VTTTTTINHRHDRKNPSPSHRQSSPLLLTDTITIVVVIAPPHRGENRELHNQARGPNLHQWHNRTGDPKQNLAIVVVVVVD
jgi:hypothetical protein